ncbi:unnamed protein product, partial [Candidula unifasciata]
RLDCIEGGTSTLFLRVRTIGLYLLSLCEVEVYGGKCASLLDDTICLFVCLCDHGWYGRDCEHRCNCADSNEVCFVASGGCPSGCALCLADTHDVNVCHHVNGTCLLGCQIGFKGPWCNMTCTPGTYGHGCNYMCSQLCAPDVSNSSSPACHHLHGVCLNGCQAGYKGQMCNQICPPGQFGQDCSLTCAQSCLPDNRKIHICHLVTGRCLLGCLPGYEGARCNQTCKSGLYGVLCKLQCPQFCSWDPTGTPSCDHVTGLCVGGCQPGYTGEMCNTLCQPGMYGPDCSCVCSELCAVNSDGNHQCHHITGACLRGCQRGYTGAWCNNTCEDGSHGDRCSLPCPEFCDVSDIDVPACHHIDGTCSQGCQDGYQGPTCNK